MVPSQHSARVRPESSDQRDSLRQKVLTLFTDEKRFWWFCVYLFGSFAVIKGLRFPGKWASAEAQLDYSYGLIKRGLLGAIYHALHAQSYRGLTLMAALEFAAFLVLLFVFTRRSGIEQRFGSVAPFALFVSSYAITFLAHLIGFTEIVGAILVIALLMIRSPRVRFLIGLPTVALAVLIHEDFLLLFLPLLLLSFVFDYATSESRRRNTILIQGAVLAGFAVAFTLILFRRYSLTPLQIDHIRSTVVARVNFPIDENVFETLGRPFVEDLKITGQQMSHVHWWAYFAISLCVMLPVAIPLLEWTTRMVRQSKFGAAHGNTWLVPAVLVAAASPLLLHVIGYDQVRWNAVCTLNIYLTLLLTSISLPRTFMPISVPGQRLVGVLIALNMASGWGFFDALNINPYPFFPILFSRFK